MIQVPPELRNEIKSFYEKNREFIDYLAENSKNNLIRAMALIIKEISGNDW